MAYRSHITPNCAKWLKLQNSARKNSAMPDEKLLKSHECGGPPSPVYLGDLHYTVKEKWSFASPLLSILDYNTASLWHQMRGFSTHQAILEHKTPPTPQLRMPTSSSYRLEVPITTSSGSISLLEWLTEAKKTVYLLDYWFILKGCNSRTPRWKRYKRQGCVGKGVDLPCPLWACPSPSIFPCSPT